MRLVFRAVLAAGLVCARALADNSAPALDAEAQAARAQVSASLGVIQSSARRARLALQRARRSGDLAEIACTDEGLSRVDMASRQARDSAPFVTAAFGRGDAPAARALLARIVTAAQTARYASSRAEACLPDLREHDATTVRLVIDVRLPLDDRGS